MLLASQDEVPLEAKQQERLAAAFARSTGHGLLALGGREVGSALPPSFAYWRELGARFVTTLCTLPDATVPEAPSVNELASLVSKAPSMAGGEYLSTKVLSSLWSQVGEAFTEELRASGLPLEDFLKQLNPAWNLVGRVHFNLAENRRDEEAPFAFLATYTKRLAASGKAQHQPLGEALREYAGAANKERLLALLLPVQRAAESCAWLKQLVDASELFHPLRWSPREAFQLLGDVHALEQAGVVVRMPATWRGGRPARAQATGTVGTKAPGGVGKDALLDFKAQLTLDGEPLTPAEMKALLRDSRGLAFIRGQWVEVDRERLERTLSRFQEAEQVAKAQGLSFVEAMRLLAGAAITENGAEDLDPTWGGVAAGPWLAKQLEGLRSPEGLAQVDPGKELRGELRPYQRVGVRWLHLLSQLGLGACLADDMGLGKTVQVISMLLVRRQSGQAGTAGPSLLVAPASLLANWASELRRFAPSLKALVAHPSGMTPEALKALSPTKVAEVDLVVTSYGALLRQPWLQEASWQLVVLDEAQAIKNPDTKQTRAVKKLSSHARIALTGTPIENRLSDLWSLFDFTHPGLLGSAKEFAAYAKRLTSGPGASYAPLRELVRPYILRRLKTDRAVISDLPEKTELKAYCGLSRKQAALYQQAVDELAQELKAVDGMKRRGVVLAFLMRFKQLCNHPSQWLGDGAWAPEDSGKLARLGEIAEVVASKQEKMLVFTQFRETTGPLATFLGSLFGRPGLVLHGETEVKKRKDLVQRFQDDETVPFFVLSLKAGGSGLNLTAASHVVHFDRWWNPAVENQATDRAFRIGQKRNVLVHKLVCRGTVEEKIDALIESKTQLTKELLEGGGELNLTELSNEELMQLVTLDLNAAQRE
jgi:non-specific serine/threonine protein kinase